MPSDARSIVDDAMRRFSEPERTERRFPIVVDPLSEEGRQMDDAGLSGPGLARYGQIHVPSRDCHCMRPMVSCRDRSIIRLIEHNETRCRLVVNPDPFGCRRSGSVVYNHVECLEIWDWTIIAGSVREDVVAVKAFCRLWDVSLLRAFRTGAPRGLAGIPAVVNLAGRSLPRSLADLFWFDLLSYESEPCRVLSRSGRHRVSLEGFDVSDLGTAVFILDRRVSIPLPGGLS